MLSYQIKLAEAYYAYYEFLDSTIYEKRETTNEQPNY